MIYQCPVCLYSRLPYPPRDYHICPCCGTEFGNDDVDFSHDQLREMWVAGGANWFFGRPPDYWNPWVQLLEAGHFAMVPQVDVKYLQSEGSTRRVSFDQEFQLSMHG
jgi:hypothetical protein